jgi:CheY-like chemotaxis protein/HPt (histidine-containing phosphotransfer) domain-containing protein
MAAGKSIPSNSIFPFILIAEDNPVNRQVIGLLFKNINIPIEFASNGREALTFYASRRHSLILMDIQMPEMDGIEATRLIRSDSTSNPQPIIIALTAQSEEPVSYYTNLGFNDFLQKPLKLAALKKMLDQYLVKNTDTVTNPLASEQTVSNDTPTGSIVFDEHVFEEMQEALGEGSEEILVGLINTYLNHTPTLFVSLEEALIKNDLTTIHRVVHTLKSSSANMGLMQLSDLSKQMETWLKPMLRTAFNPQELSKIKDRIVDNVGILQTAFSQGSSDLKAYQIKLNNGNG